MMQRYVRLEASPPLDPKYYDRPWYCEPYRCDGCARQFGLQGPAHTRLICYRFGIELTYKLCPDCVASLRDVGPSSEEGVAEQDKQEVVLTSDDVETLLRALNEMELPFSYSVRKDLSRENDVLLAKIDHASKALTGGVV